jgi:hypothetical protein
MQYSAVIGPYEPSQDAIEYAKSTFLSKHLFGDVRSTCRPTDPQYRKYVGEVKYCGEVLGWQHIIDRVCEQAGDGTKVRDRLTPDWFFFGEPGNLDHGYGDTRTYLPIPIMCVGSNEHSGSSRSYDSLDTLVADLETQGASHGILLYGKTGGGKTVSTKAVELACFFGTQGDDESLSARHSRLIPVRILPSDGDRLPELPTGETHHRDDPFHILFAATRLEEREDPVEWIKFQLKYLGKKLLVLCDLNAVEENQRQRFAHALRILQKEHNCRVIITYRSTRTGDGIITELLSGGVFCEYQLQDLKAMAAKAYLRNLRELERRVYESLDLIAHTRDVDSELEQLDALIKQHQSNDNSLISTPLLMHFVSLLEPSDLQQGISLSGLYDRISQQFYQREQFNYGTNLPSILRGEFGFDSFRKTMSGVALDILNQGSASVRLPRKELQLSLAWSSSCRAASELVRVGNSVGCDAVIPSQDFARSILELSVLNRSESEIGFIHDSFVYYFASLAIVEAIQSDDRAGLDAVLNLFDREPEKWLLVAEFAAGGLSPDRTVDLLAGMLAECQRDGISKLILAFALNSTPNTSQSSRLLALIAEAIRHHGTWCHENPDAIMSTVYNWLASEAEEVPFISEFLERTFIPAINRSERRWFRHVFGSTQQSCPTLEVSDGKVVGATHDANGNVYFVKRSSSDESRHTLCEWFPQTAESRTLLSFNLPGHRPEVESFTILNQSVVIVSGCSMFEPAEPWFKATIHPDHFPKRSWLYGFSKTDDGHWISTCEITNKLIILPPSRIEQPIVCVSETHVEFQWLGREWDASELLPIDFGTTRPKTIRTYGLEKALTAIAWLSQSEIIGVDSQGKISSISIDGATQQRDKLQDAKYIGLVVAPDNQNFIARTSDCALVFGKEFATPLEVENAWFIEDRQMVYAQKSSDEKSRKLYLRRLVKRQHEDKLLLETHSDVLRVLAIKIGELLVVCKGRTFHLSTRGKLIEGARYSTDIFIVGELEWQLLAYDYDRLKVGTLSSFDDYSFHEFELDGVFEPKDRENSKFLQHNPVAVGDKTVITDENSVFVVDKKGRIVSRHSLPFGFSPKFVIRLDSHTALLASDVGQMLRLHLATGRTSRFCIPVPRKDSNTLHDNDEGRDRLQECFHYSPEDVAFVFFHSEIQIHKTSQLLTSLSHSAPDKRISHPDTGDLFNPIRFEYIGGSAETGIFALTHDRIYRFPKEPNTVDFEVEEFSRGQRLMAGFDFLRPHAISLRHGSIACFKGMWGESSALDLDSLEVFDKFAFAMQCGRGVAIGSSDNLINRSVHLTFVGARQDKVDLGQDDFVASDVCNIGNGVLLVSHYFRDSTYGDGEDFIKPEIAGKVTKVNCECNFSRETIFNHDSGLDGIEELADRKLFVKERGRGWAIFSSETSQPIIRAINLNGKGFVKYIPWRGNARREVVIEFVGNQLSIADARSGVTIVRTYVPEVPREVILHGTVILCKLRDRWTGIYFENTLADDDLCPLHSLSRFTERIELNELLFSYFTLRDIHPEVEIWVNARIRELVRSDPTVEEVGVHLSRYVSISANQRDFAGCDRYIEWLTELLRDLSSVSDELSKAAEQVIVALLRSAQHVVSSISKESQSIPIAWHQSKLDQISRQVLSVLKKVNSSNYATYNNFLTGLRANLAMHFMRQHELAAFLRCFESVTVFEESTWTSLVDSPDMDASFIASLLDEMLDTERVYSLGFTTSTGTRRGIDAWIAMLQACVSSKSGLNAIEDSSARFTELISDALQIRRTPSESFGAFLDLAIIWCSGLVEWRVKSDECVAGYIEALLSLFGQDSLFVSNKDDSPLSRVILSLRDAESGLFKRSADVIYQLCGLAQRLNKPAICRTCVEILHDLHEVNPKSRDIWLHTSNSLLFLVRSMMQAKMFEDAGHASMDFIQFRRRLICSAKGSREETMIENAEHEYSSSIEEFFSHSVEVIPDLLASSVTRLMFHDGLKWPVVLASSISRLCRFLPTKEQGPNAACFSQVCCLFDAYLTLTTVQTSWLRKMIGNADAWPAGQRETHLLDLAKFSSITFNLEAVQAVLALEPVRLARMFLEWRSSQDLSSGIDGIEVDFASAGRHLQTLVDYLENKAVPPAVSEFDEPIYRLLICAAIVQGDKHGARNLIQHWLNRDEVGHDEIQLLATRLDGYAKDGFLSSDLLCEDQLAALEELRSAPEYPLGVFWTMEIDHPVYFLSQFDDTKPPPRECHEWYEALDLDDLETIYQRLVEESMLEKIDDGMLDNTEVDVDSKKRAISQKFMQLSKPEAIQCFWRTYDLVFTERLLDVIELSGPLS